MSKIYRWGIVGLGKIARKFADDLRLLPNAKLHAVASTDLVRAANFAAEYQVPNYFGRYEDIVSCPDLDVVYIAMPHVGHAAASIFCLENKIPVLVEKPFAMHQQEAAAMIATARKHQVFLMEALWTRFIPAVDKVFNLLNNNSIGRVHTIRADIGFHAPFDAEWRIFNKKLGGGALLDIGIYPVLLSNFVFGKPEPSQIQAAATFTQTGVDETCAMIFKFPENRLSILHASIASNTSRMAEIYGKLGTITLFKRWHHAYEITVSKFDDAARTEIITEEIKMPYEGWGYTFEAAHVMECLDKNLLESPLVPLQFSADLVATLDAVREKIGLDYPVG